MKTRLYRLACVRGQDTFGLSLWANNTKHALTLAKSMLIGSGYSVYPAKS